MGLKHALTENLEIIKYFVVVHTFTIMYFWVTFLLLFSVILCKLRTFMITNRNAISFFFFWGAYMIKSKRLFGFSED